MLAPFDGDPYRSAPPPLCPPPRRVPLSVRLVLACGGFNALFGWAFIVISGGFWLIAADGGSFVRGRNVERVAARLTSVEQLPPRSKHKEHPYALHFSFTSGGRTHTGTSYAKRPPTVVDGWDADVPRDYPRFACLRGAECEGAPAVAVVVGGTVTLLIGLWFVVGAARTGRRAALLLEHGAVTRGRLVGKRATNVTVNDRLVWELRFEFETADGVKRHAWARTNRPEVLEDEPNEQLLYLPADPSQATVVDHLPGAPRVTRDGHIAPASLRNVVLVSILPVAALILHVVGPCLALW
jgi:hypothetical protein